MILRNAVFSWVSMSASTLLALITSPFIVAYLGIEAYGLWLLLSNLSIFFNLFELGIPTALGRQLAAYLAQGDEERAAKVVGTSLSLLLAIGLITMGVFLVMSLFADSVFNIPRGMEGSAVYGLILVGLVTAFTFPSRIFDEILTSQEKHYQAYSVETGAQFIRLGLILVILPLGGGFTGLVQIHFWVMLASFTALGFFALRTHPAISRPKPGFDRAEFKGLFSYAKDMLMITVGMRAMQQIPVLLLGVFAGTGQVARYGVGNRLVAQQNQLVQVAVGVTQPRFTALGIKHQAQAAGELLIRSCLYAGLMAGYMGLGMLLFAHRFMLVWMGPEFSAAATVALLISLPLSLVMAVRPCEVMLLGTAQHGLTGKVQLGEAGIILALSWPAIHFLGMEALAGVVGFSVLTMRPWLIPAKACRLAGLKVGELWLRGLLRPGLTCLTAGLLGFWGLRYWPVSGWWDLISGIAGFSLLFALCTALIGLGPDERAFWKDKLAGLLKRRN